MDRKVSLSNRHPWLFKYLEQTAAQGENKIVTDMFGYINAFESKLKLFECQLKMNNFTNFEKQLSLKNSGFRLRGAQFQTEIQ